MVFSLAQALHHGKLDDPLVIELLNVKGTEEEGAALLKAVRRWMERSAGSPTSGSSEE
jgi:hypothetical protein